MKFNEVDFQIKILILLVTHPELNTIQMVQSKIKREVAAKNLNFRLSAVEEMTKQAVLKFTASEFTKYVEHIKPKELKFEQMNSLIIYYFYWLLKQSIFMELSSLFHVLSSPYGKNYIQN